jgi:hypothetical protein
MHDHELYILYMSNIICMSIIGKTTWEKVGSFDTCGREETGTEVFGGKA